MTEYAEVKADINDVLILNEEARGRLFVMWDMTNCCSLGLVAFMSLMRDK
jgi:hypothetical protein